MMDTLWRDLHYGLRRLAADRRLAVMVVVILALGIGPNALIFSILRAILLSSRGYTVVGVMPEAFDFPRLLMPRWGAVDVWLPLRLPPQELLDMTLTVVARLQPGVSPQIASRRMTALMTPETRKEVVAVNVVNMRTAVFGKARSSLLLLAGVGAFVLLLASANVTNL